MQVLLSLAVLAGEAMVMVVPRSAACTAAPPVLLTAPEPQPEMPSETLATAATGVLSAGRATDSVGESPPVIDAGVMTKVLDASTGAGTTASVPVAVTAAALEGVLETVSV